MSTRRVSSGCLASVVLLVVLAIVAAVLVRRALDPQSIRRFAEARLSAAIGQPVTIGRMDVSLLPTPRVDGSDIRVAAARAANTPSVTLGTLRIVPRLSSLFSEPIVVERIEVERLVLQAVRDAAGKWTLPLPASSGQSGSASSPAVDIGQILLKDASLLVVDQVRPATSPAGIRHLDAAMALEGGEAHVNSMTAKVGGSTLSGRGSASARGVRMTLEWQSLKPADLPEVFALLGTEAPPGLVVEGERPLSLDITVDARGSITASGKIAASRVSLGTLALSALESPVQLAANRVTLEPLTFALYGGQQRGALTADMAKSPASWTVRTGVSGVDVNQLLSANTAAKNKVSGTGRLDAVLSGSMVPALSRSMDGTIAVEVARGAIHDFPLVSALNTALHLGTSATGNDLHFETLAATLRVADGTLSTDDLRATSGDLLLHATGTIRADLGLDFAGTARFTRARSDELVRRAKDLGGLRNPQGEIELPFVVRGTAGAPTVSVELQKVLQRAATKEVKRQVGRQLKKLIKIR